MIHSTALRNAQAGSFSTLVDAGSAGGKIKLRTGGTPGAGTLLATFMFDTVAFGAASGGTVTAASFPKTVNGVASGTIGNYEITDSDDNPVGSGTSVGVGSGECNMSSLSVVNGQPVTLNGFSYTIGVGA